MTAPGARDGDPSGGHPPSAPPATVPARRWRALPFAGLAAAAVVALALAAASLIPAHDRVWLIGRPGDAQAVERFYPSSTHLDTPGRWTRGDGVVLLPRVAAPAVVALKLAAPDARVPDTIEIAIGGAQVSRHTLAAGWNEIHLPVDSWVAASGPRAGATPEPGAGTGAGAAAAPAIRVQIRSATSVSPEGRPLGLFVERVTLKTGGLASLRRTPRATWLWLSLTSLAIVIIARRMTRGGASRRADVIVRAAAQIVVLLLAWAALVACRVDLFTRLPIVALLAGVTAASLVLAGSAGAARRLDALSPARTIILFGVCALLLIGLLLPETWRHGYVLSQADMFFEYYPWRAHVPADYRPLVDRPPLGDIPMMVYPFLAFAQSRWWEGTFPLWTSAVNAGQPFLGTFQSALLAPLTWVAAVMPLPQATVWIAVLRLLVGGTGMFAYLRTIGLSRWASAFGGVTFLLNPYSLVWLEHPPGGVPPWLPWMLLAAERLGASAFSSSSTSASSLSASPSSSDASSRACMDVSARTPPSGLAPSSPPASSWTSVGFLALTTALVLTGGHPHTALFVAAFAGVYALLGARTVRGAARVAGALALGLALSAVQVLPFVEYLSLSHGAVWRNQFPLNPFIAPASTLITAIVPNFLGHHGYGNYAGPTNYLEQQIYPGIATWLLAAIGVASGARRWRTWFFTIAGLIAMLVMYGAPGVHQIVSALPLLKAASLPRIAIVALASLAVLAAYGVDDLLRAAAAQRRRGGRVQATPLRGPESGSVPSASSSPGPSLWPSPSPIRVTLTLLSAAAILAILALATLHGADRRAVLDTHGLTAFATHWTWFALGLAAAVVVIGLAALWRLTDRSTAVAALVALAAFDLLIFGRGFRPLIPASQVYPMVPEIAMVQQDRDLFRVMGAGGALMPNAAMVYGLQDVRGYDGLTVDRYAQLLQSTFKYEFQVHSAVTLQMPLINLLNVKYVFGVPNIPAPEGWFVKLTDGEAPLYRNTRVFPRAFLVDQYIVQDGNPARRTLRDARVDLRRITLLEQDPPADKRPVTAASAEAVGTARVTHYRDQFVEIETDAAERRLLVLTDVHYPGWTATVDGRPAPIHRANFAFRAVPVPAGRHTVRFTYRPVSVIVGAVVSTSAAAILLAAPLIARRRRTPAMPIHTAASSADRHGAGGA